MGLAGQTSPLTWRPRKASLAALVDFHTVLFLKVPAAGVGSLRAWKTDDIIKHMPWG